MPAADSPGWIVCQIGARENYAIARALSVSDNLQALITDIWSPPSRIGAHMLPMRMNERWHADLSSAAIYQANAPAVIRSVMHKLWRKPFWQRTIADNHWFQRMATRKLAGIEGNNHTLFAYSYAARDIMAEAKRRKWRTVLGQIDPGPVEAKLVSRVYAEAGQAHCNEEIPDQYWANWREEIRLADRIVVNSEWSRRAIVREGAPEEKIRVIPLAYEVERDRVERAYPSQFTNDRPLRLLFLGWVSLRKGIDQIFNAWPQLNSLPVELDVVGSMQVDVPEVIRNDPRIQFHGHVPRSQTEAFYQKADLFLFPTRSDGFGLTQLEALSFGCPVIASNNCGDVITHGVNGFRLETTEPHELADLLRRVIADPTELKRLQAQVGLGNEFSISRIGQQLLKIF